MSLDDNVPELNLTVSQFNPLYSTILKAMGSMSDDGKTLIMNASQKLPILEMSVTLGDTTVTYYLDTAKPQMSYTRDRFLLQTTWAAKVQLPDGMKVRIDE